MPLFREPTTQELEDHFFGSGAFSFEWFGTRSRHFPATIDHYEDTLNWTDSKIITEADFVEAIKKYAETLPDRSFDDLIEDMDAGDVDNVIQLAYFGEIRYA